MKAQLSQLTQHRTLYVWFLFISSKFVESGDISMKMFCTRTSQKQIKNFTLVSFTTILVKALIRHKEMQGGITLFLL